MAQIMTPADIRDLRIRTGLTQAQFALKLRVSTRAVTSWELGERYPSTRTYLKLLDICAPEKR